MTAEEKEKFIASMERIAERFALLNGYIQRGEPIPEELTKNFVTFPLHDDPYSLLDDEPGTDEEDEDDDYRGMPITHAAVKLTEGSEKRQTKEVKNTTPPPAPPRPTVVEKCTFCYQEGHSINSCGSFIACICCG